MSEESEMIGVTPEMVEHTNMTGDVSDNKKHFMEISFEGFRICVSTSENSTLDSFNDSVLSFWEKLDGFLQERSKRAKKTMRMDPSELGPEVG